MYALIALLGTGVTALAFVAAAANVSLGIPSVDALIAACRRLALPEVTVTSVAGLILGSGAFAVVLLAVRSALRQIRDTRRFVASLHVIGPARVGPPRTYVFADDAPNAFCAGLLRPRIFVSTGTLETLRRDELDAVLAHEAHHARSRDPLRLLLARTARDGLFFLPGMHDLAERYAALAEVAADGAAVRASGGDRGSLAAALLAFDSATSSAVVGIAPERVDTLLGERPTWQLPLALLATALVVLTSVGIVAMRVADASAHSALNLPLFLASLCMLAMAVVPLLIGAMALLGTSRVARLRTR
ncbi:MAG: M56 family metallopeptidase [Actinomycetota bacterium]|nr:M56 family metallopeptidase [Actinomycetota bacterium]